MSMENASMIISSGNCDMNGCPIYEYIGTSQSRPIPVNFTLIKAQGNFYTLNSSLYRRKTINFKVYEKINSSSFYDY